MDTSDLGIELSAMTSAAYYVSVYALGVLITVFLGFGRRCTLSQNVSRSLVLLLPGIWVSVFAVLYTTAGRTFIERGDLNPELTARIDLLTDALESQRSGDDGRFSIVLLGDSVHYKPVKEASKQVLAQFRDQFPGDLKNRTQIYGTSMMGFGAHDYYRIANLLIDEAPDMIVVPVNLRSFTPDWHELQTVSYPRLMRYVRIREIPRASALSDSTHDYRWDIILLKKLDVSMFEGAIGLFFEGLRQTVNGYVEGFDARCQERFSGFALPVPPDWLTREERLEQNPAIQYPDSVTRDHSTMKAFLELGDLAHRHGIQLVYYTVHPYPPRSYAARHFPYIREVLSDHPNVYFLDVLDALQPIHFSMGDHLSEEGMRILSARLGVEVGALVRKMLSE